MRRARDLEEALEGGGRHVQARRGHYEVMPSHQSVQLRDRLGDFRAHAILALLRDRRLGDDPLGWKLVEKVLAARDPGQVTAQPRHDANASLGKDRKSTRLNS